MAEIYPKTMPVLRASDFCRYSYSNDKGQHCLTGWLSLSLGKQPDYVAHHFGDDLQRFIGMSVVEFNDDTRNSKAKLAKTWNRFCASLGYTEPVR